jgi:hypothetical protein
MGRHGELTGTTTQWDSKSGGGVDLCCNEVSRCFPFPRVWSLHLALYTHTRARFRSARVTSSLVSIHHPRVGFILGYPPVSSVGSLPTAARWWDVGAGAGTRTLSKPTAYTQLLPNHTTFTDSHRQPPACPIFTLDALHVQLDSIHDAGFRHAWPTSTLALSTPSNRYRALALIRTYFPLASGMMQLVGLWPRGFPMRLGLH